MILYYIEAPATRVYDGLVAGTIMFHKNMSELMTRKEAQRVLANIGGQMHQVNIALDHKTLTLVSKYPDQVTELVQKLEAENAEATAPYVPDFTKPIPSRYETAEVEARNKLRAEEAAQLSAENEVNEEIPEGPLAGIEPEPDEPGHEVQEEVEAKTENADIQSVDDVEFPTYQQMRKELAEADRSDLEFDSKELMGGKSDKATTQRAWLALHLLKLNLETVE